MKPLVAVAALLPVTSSALRGVRLQDSMSMSIVTDATGLPLMDLPSSPGFPPCNICGEGNVITNPDAVVQFATLAAASDIPGTIEDKSCLEFAADGQNGLIPEEECVLLPIITRTLCGCQSPTDLVETVPAALPVLDQDKCSCSPKDFTFKLQLDRDCDTDTVSGTPGVEVAVCNVRGGAGEIDYSTLEIVDIQFLEFGSAGLEVINQNETYTNTSLVSGDTFTFPSISNMLSPDMSIEEQLQYYPTGVSLTMEGNAKDSDGNDVTVRNQVAWAYTESCGALPISVGQAIGWVDIAVTEAPLPEFCSALPPPITTDATTFSTTTTGATMTTTTSTSTTTTEATITTTTSNSATTTEATMTTTTSTSHSMSVTTTAATFFGKTGKIPKAKTLKDPMAKVAKSASNDAKAEKVSKSSKSVKTAKLEKDSTKSRSANMSM